MPKEYTVTWKIDIQADSPEEAAKIARVIQLDPDSTAEYFEVREFGMDDPMILVNLEDTITRYQCRGAGDDPEVSIN